MSKSSRWLPCFLVLAACTRPPPAPPELELPAIEECADPALDATIEDIVILRTVRTLGLDELVVLRDGDAIGHEGLTNGTFRRREQAFYVGLLGPDAPSCARVELGGVVEGTYALPLTREGRVMVSRAIFTGPEIAGEIPIRARAYDREVDIALWDTGPDLALLLPSLLDARIAPSEPVFFEPAHVEFRLEPGELPDTLRFAARGAVARVDPAPHAEAWPGRTTGEFEVSVSEPGPLNVELWLDRRPTRVHQILLDFASSRDVSLELPLPGVAMAGPGAFDLRVWLDQPAGEDLTITSSSSTVRVHGEIAEGADLGFLHIEIDEVLAEEITIDLELVGSYTTGRAELWIYPDRPHHPGRGEFVPNEIHYRPTFDLNCDGTVDAGDRFVEFVSRSSSPLDLRDISLLDGASFDLTLQAFESVVVLASAPASSECPTAGGRLGRAHVIVRPLPDGSGGAYADVTLIQATTGIAVERVSLPLVNFPTGVSMQREPDYMLPFNLVTGMRWVPHTEIAGSLGGSSPGRAASE